MYNSTMEDTSSGVEDPPVNDDGLTEAEEFDSSPGFSLTASSAPPVDWSGQR